MFTPIEDIDIFYLLPYLSLHELVRILRVRKRLPLEYKLRLNSFKWSTLCDMSFHTQLPCDSIRYVAVIDELSDEKWKEEMKAVYDIRLKRDSNGISYLRIVYPNKVHTHIIYDRKVKLEDESILLYTK